MPCFQQYLLVLFATTSQWSMQSHSFLEDSLAFLHFRFWKETKIWDPCAFATSPPAATAPLSAPGSQFPQFLFVPLFSKHSCSISLAHTPHSPAIHILLTSSSPARLPETLFHSPHNVWCLIVFLGSHAYFTAQSSSLREASSSQQGFHCFYLTRQTIDRPLQLETPSFFFPPVAQLADRLFQPHRLDVIQKPHTGQARF